MRFIGCKTQLLENIEAEIDRYAPGAESFCDIFSGTAAVARYFKPKYTIFSNDLLYFSYCLQRATIENDAVPDFDRLRAARGISDPLLFLNGAPLSEMELLPQPRRLFQNAYSPRGGRMYLTEENALRIDFARNTVEAWRAQDLLRDSEYFYLVACIVEGVPFVSNISGTYGAYNKFWDKRSFKTFEAVRLDVHSNHRDNRSYNEDGEQLLGRISGDILYVDPPYNGRQYLPNYHVLETCARYDFPELRGLTGQRAERTPGSAFCRKTQALAAFCSLLRAARFRHIFLSYNSEGILSPAEIREAMVQVGIPGFFHAAEIPHRRFKSRGNEKAQPITEYIFHIEKEV